MINDRKKQLEKLIKLATIFNEAQSLYYIDANDEDDSFILFLMDPSTERTIRVFYGTYKECKDFIKEMPIITLSKKGKKYNN